MADPVLGSIQDILHEFLSGASMRPNAPFKRPRLEAIKTLTGALLVALRAIIASPVAQFTGDKAKIWALSTTQNQSEGTAPVMDRLGQDGWHAVIYDPYSFWGKSLAIEVLRAFPKALRHMLALPVSDLEDIADLGGLYIICLAEAACFKAISKQNLPAILLLSNDHSPRNRAIYSAARRARISTAYLQHAAVGGIERALDMDVAFLQGRQSLSVYEKIGPISANVKLVGSPKIDAYRRKREVVDTDRPAVIGLFPGLFDEPGFVKAALKQIQAGRGEYSYKLRPHPRDTRSDWQILAQTMGVHLEESYRSTMDILSECDIVIFDDSNVGLEAVALGISVLRTRFSENTANQYGFAESKIFAEHCVPVSNLVSAIIAALKREIAIDIHELDYIYEGWSSHSFDADIVVADSLLSYLV